MRSQENGITMKKQINLFFKKMCVLEIKGFPGGSDGKESACSVRDLGSIPGLGRCPGGGHGNPLQYSCLENPHGQRSLEGYSPWGLKELDTTEPAHTCTYNNVYTYIICCILFHYGLSYDILYSTLCYTIGH